MRRLTNQAITIGKSKGAMKYSLGGCVITPRERCEHTCIILLSFYLSLFYTRPLLSGLHYWSKSMAGKRLRVCGKT